MQAIYGEYDTEAVADGRDRTDGTVDDVVVANAAPRISSHMATAIVAHAPADYGVKA